MDAYQQHQDDEARAVSAAGALVLTILTTAACLAALLIHATA